MIQSVNPAPTDETDGLPMPKRIWAVISVGFALCMSVLDVNIINIVLPTLSHDFGTSPAVTTWIINGYQLAIVVSLLSFSALGEIIGYRKVYLSGIGLFCITSLICALSDSFWTLTIARIFQGFSASAITSVNTAQLRYIYPKGQLGRGMGVRKVRRVRLPCGCISCNSALRVPSFSITEPTHSSGTSIITSSIGS